MFYLLMSLPSSIQLQLLVGSMFYFRIFSKEGMKRNCVGHYFCRVADLFVCISIPMFFFWAVFVTL